MNKIKKIIEIGAEGGSITLYGLEVAGEWHFSLETDESTLRNLMCKGDQKALERFFVQRTSAVKGFENGLKLLNRYPWHRLYPQFVHPQFSEEVLAEVKRKMDKHDSLYKWESAIERSRMRNPNSEDY